MHAALLQVFSVSAVAADPGSRKDVYLRWQFFLSSACAESIVLIPTPSLREAVTVAAYPQLNNTVLAFTDCGEVGTGAGHRPLPPSAAVPFMCQNTCRLPRRAS